MRIISIYTIKRTESYGVDFINVNLFLEKPYAAILRKMHSIYDDDELMLNVLRCHLTY